MAAVWVYEGLWCKLLRGQPHQLEVVGAVPWLGPRVWSSADLVFKQAIAPHFLAAWEQAGLACMRQARERAARVGLGGQSA